MGKIGRAGPGIVVGTKGVPNLKYKVGGFSQMTFAIRKSWQVGGFGIAD